MGLLLLVGFVLCFIGLYLIFPIPDGRFTTGFKGNREPNYELGLMFLGGGGLLIFILWLLEKLLS
tara:strand:+ start:156 stop:350 length:195 start_codon:yes stop_codon:yes gene_type:complete